MAYSEEDINSAVAAGALSAEAAASFRAHMTQLRDMPRGDEENFRLINSFNDIFVAIGVIIMLVAAGAIGQALVGLFIEAPVRPDYNDTAVAAGQWDAYYAANSYRDAWQALVASLFVAATTWPLAEFFTRKRRMALPSIILLIAFVGSFFAAAIASGEVFNANDNDWMGALLIAGAGVIAAGAAWLHWKRFKVPITVAAGAGAVAVIAVALPVAIVEGLEVMDGGDLALILTFIAGVGIFALAMRWDMTDRERITRRSDVAFWLHLLAAPMIAHPIFYSLGVLDNTDNISTGAAFAVIAIYVVFGLIALAIDRRAMLVSALAYVLAALALLFDRFGAVELTFALTALVIGSALLSLSAFWTPIRARVVAPLPEEWQAKLPAIIEPADPAMAPSGA